jgi:hypothetical protein
MRLIKFISDYVKDDILIQRNSIYEYVDKREVLITEECEAECSKFGFEYKIEYEGELIYVGSDYIVELSAIPYNPDYTPEDFIKEMTKDALVKDGDYVKIWEETFGINKPVKEVADQSDYTGEWKALQKEIDKKHGDGGFLR